MQHTIEKRGKLLKYINIESLSKEDMNKYFQLWCNRAESYPYLYHIIQNKLHYHILNGPTLIFPSKEQKIKIINTEQFSQIINDIFKKKDGSGRVGAFELLVSTPPARNLIREHKIHQITSVMQTSQRDGMITMEKSIEDLISRGDISNAEKNS